MQAAGITFVITATVMLAVGVVVGHLITYCILKRRKNNVQLKQEVGGASDYVETSHYKAETIEIGENVAYGQCN